MAGSKSRSDALQRLLNRASGPFRFSCAMLALEATMRSRILFPGDQVLKNATEITIQLVRVQGQIALHYEIHGNVNDPICDRFAQGTKGGAR